MRTPRHWQYRGLLACLLWPASLLYRLGFALDRAGSKPRRAPLPVIGIGNATAGGAGKTPAAIAVVALLKQLGETPHIVTRGYGGTLRGPHQVDAARDTAARVGDEALLLAQHAPTWVARRRIDAAAPALAQGATVLVADDAMQHHALYKNINLMVVDLQHGFGNGLLLPAGPLREDWREAAQRSIVIAIGDSDPANLQLLLKQHATALLRATLAPVGETGWLNGTAWLAFAGIAYPQKFYATLHACGATVAATEDFADHHPFLSAQLDALLSRCARNGWQPITTEKDWVRLPAAYRESIRCLPVALQWAQPQAAGALLQERLSQAR